MTFSGPNSESPRKRGRSMECAAYRPGTSARSGRRGRVVAGQQRLRSEVAVGIKVRLFTRLALVEQQLDLALGFSFLLLGRVTLFAIEARPVDRPSGLIALLGGGAIQGAPAGERASGLPLRLARGG